MPEPSLGSQKPLLCRGDRSAGSAGSEGFVVAHHIGEHSRQHEEYRQHEQPFLLRFAAIVVVMPAGVLLSAVVMVMTVMFVRHGRVALG